MAKLRREIQMPPEPDDGGPAFPLTVPDFRDYENQPQPGMSLRDWFAGMALSGLLASDEWVEVEDGAYKIADKMLAERQHPAQQPETAADAMNGDPATGNTTGMGTGE
jgi:hypothetical protein